MEAFTFSDEQLAVINTPEQRVFVPAHAGSGKTSTLCARIRRLLDRGVLESDILALSFSNKACNVIRDRLDNDVTVQTFHAFGYNLVRDGRNHTGLKLVTPTISTLLLGRTLFEYKALCTAIRRKTEISLRTKQGYKRLADFFSRTQDGDAGMVRVASDVSSSFADFLPVLPELRRIRRAYDEMLARHCVIDYPSMLSRAVELVGTSALPYRYLFVDEYQDMSGAQAKLLKALALRIPNVMVFGDPRQAVFGFMGAMPRDIPKLIGGAVTMPLMHSFRLTHETAATANAILATDDELPVIGNRFGSKPTFAKCHTATYQENLVIQLIKNLKSMRVSGDKIGILARTKLQLRNVEQALRAAGYETLPQYGLRMPEHTDRLLDLLAFIERCAASAAKGNKPKRVWRAKRLQAIANVTVAKPVINACLLKLIAASRTPSFEGRYIAATRLYLMLMRAAGQDASRITIELGRWTALSRKFKTVEAFRTHVDKLSQQTPIVTSTIHGAKGDEWDHVIVLGVTEGSIPFFMGDENEERRLFYVAVTRARKHAYLFHAPYHHANSRQTFAERSSFLTDEVQATLQPYRLG
jgi:DNA helicase-2/ATP-dependent DNA helicase PcrA